MILFGEPVAKKITDDIKNQIKAKQASPGLAVILIGNNPASEIYVKVKVEKSKMIGIQSYVHRLPSDATQSQILDIIYQLNIDPNVHGILIQLPLPKHINSQAIIQAISPSKDVDGFHPVNVGKLLADIPGGFIPCTPAAILEIFKYYDIPLSGKNISIIGRSNIVGKPLAALLMQKNIYANATVTVLHSNSHNIISNLKNADIIVACIGQPLFLKSDMISSNTTVIDVGITRVPATSSQNGYKLIGDTDFNNLIAKCSAITPVPGGVGPITVAMLMKNTWESYLNFQSLL